MPPATQSSTAAGRLSPATARAYVRDAGERWCGLCHDAQPHRWVWLDDLWELRCRRCEALYRASGADWLVVPDDLDIAVMGVSRPPAGGLSAPATAGDTPTGRLLAALGRVRTRGRSWRARCPYHGGRSRDSLSVWPLPSGGVGLRCWSGCTRGEVLGALGLDWRELYPDPRAGGLSTHGRLTTAPVRPRPPRLARATLHRSRP